MKTLIAYCTSHGCTEKAVKELQKNLGPDVQTCNLKKQQYPSLTEFERIIVGGSIHAGQIQKRIKSFCTKNLSLLKEKELGLFICCMEEGEKARQQFNDAFPEELTRTAKATALFGGEFDLKRMNFIEKYIVKKVGNVTESVSRLDHSEILNFSKQMTGKLRIV